MFVRLAILLLALEGCGTVRGSDTSLGDAPGSDTAELEAPTERPLADGITLGRVSLFQGVENLLVQQGEDPPGPSRPVIIDRPARMRVFVNPDGAFSPRKITALLTVTADGTETELESTRRIDGPSRITDPESTIDFDLPGRLLKADTRFVLRLVEETADAEGGGDARDVTWDSDETGLAMQETDALTIVLIPIRYDADGSGRLPDTGPVQVQRIEDLVMGMYPAKQVSVRVDPPLSWPRTISPFDSEDWTDVLDELVDLRFRADEAPNTYYYGMFAPEPSIGQYCQSGCILGLSYLASTTDAFFRASIGLGYPGITTAETLVHEVGHAHGREHAPCGLYGQPSDRDYPYDNGAIGTWGFDVVTGEGFAPDTTADVMSYCSPIWVSDYTFFSLVDRMQQVADQARTAAPVMRTALRLHEDGRSTMRAPVPLGDTSGAPRVDVALFDASGAPAGRETAAFFPYDHAPGGLVALDGELPTGWTARVLP